MVPTAKPNAKSRPLPVALSVMVVEDIDEMRSLLEHVLTDAEGMKLTSLVASAAEARLALTRKRPDVVLLDEILPGESSVDLLNDLVAEGIAVILMTGITKPEHAVPPGAFSRIAKPGWKSAETDRKHLVEEIAKAHKSVFRR